MYLNIIKSIFINVNLKKPEINFRLYNFMESYLSMVVFE